MYGDAKEEEISDAADSTRTPSRENGYWGDVEKMTFGKRVTLTKEHLNRDFLHARCTNHHVLDNSLFLCQEQQR